MNWQCSVVSKACDILQPFISSNSLESSIIKRDGCNKINHCVDTADTLKPQVNIPVLVPRKLDKKIETAGDMLQQ